MKYSLRFVLLSLVCLASIGSPTTAVAGPARAVLQGVRLFIKGPGDEVLLHIDDVTKVKAGVLRSALEGAAESGVWVDIARLRTPHIVSGRSAERIATLVARADEIEGVPGLVRLLVSDVDSGVKGALGELELAAFLARRPKCEVLGVRKQLTGPLGRTDVDVVFKRENVLVYLENKEVSSPLVAGEKLKAKLLKLKRHADQDGAEVILSAGELEPSNGVLAFAHEHDIIVVWGGVSQRTRLAEAALEERAGALVR